MNVWQKRFITIVICEAWGLTTLALLLFGGFTGKGGNPYVVLIDHLIAFICAVSCCFTMRIREELFSSAVSSIPETSIAFLIQFLVYAIIGLVISICVCRKAENAE
jgi:hypothetical protein